MKNIFIVLLLFPCLVFSQGKLEKAKESLSSKSSTSTVRSATSKRATSTRNSKKSNRNSFNNNGSISGLIAEIGFYAIFGTIVGSLEYRTVTPYPYYKSSIGEYLKEDIDNSKRSIFKISGNRLFNKEARGLAFNLNYRFLPILGIEVSHLNFTEKIRNRKDYLDVSSIMVNYYRFREKRISLWWGLGASYVANEVKTLGFAYTIGTEIYPFKPISLHTSWKQSFINNNSIDILKAALKYHVKEVAFMIGYHDYQLGSENNSGFILGLEYTF